MLVDWAKEKGLPHSDVEKLIESADLQKLLKSEIDRLTCSLADYEKIKRFRTIACAARSASESGELTPTLKVKRKYVTEKYAGSYRGHVPRLDLLQLPR